MIKSPLLVVLFCAAIVPLHAAEKKPILMVLTNHGELGDTQRPTGFYLSEASHPWEVFTQAGYEVKLASPEGGIAPVDPKSLDLKDPANAAFWKTFRGSNASNGSVPETLKLDRVNPDEYAAIFFVGGHGTMWDLPQSEGVQKVTAKIYENGGVVGAVCHGPVALLEVRLKDGTLLVKDKKVAAFTDAEEAAVGETRTMPFLLETTLRKSGANVMPAANFQENAVRDGRLVTGQNPASAKKTAQLMLEALGG